MLRFIRNFPHPLEMASGAFVDPLVLLRVAPVITSTMSMRLSHDQWLFLDVFATSLSYRASDRERANEIVPSYFKAFFRRGIWDVVTLLTLTTATGICNCYSASTRPDGVWKCPERHGASSQVAGLIVFVSFSCFVVYKVQGLVEDKPKGRGLQTLREWLRVNGVRSWLADIPAWACFTVACLKSLRPL
ncbi:hypothetical protein F5Y17DRAFT_47320 [Xylariaceae sp. FL0594]|nr:hypothetical protein F5Y17DRAFT_47320 [Xylariaceae sp. FL0594]